MRLTGMARVLGLIALLLLGAGCDALLAPEPVGSATPATPRGGLVFPTAGVGAPMPTPVATPGVGRLVLATAIDAAEAPKDDRTALPAGVPLVYLAAQLNHLRRGTTLHAVWRLDGSEVARSERIVVDEAQGSRWFALPCQKQPLASGRYAVELLVNGRQIDSLVFTVGSVADDMWLPEARLAFVPAWSGGDVAGQASFPQETTQVVAVYSGFLDAGGDVYSQWYLDGRPYADVGPDPVLAAMVRSFTLRMSDPLPPGGYRVDILADGRAVASGEFSVEAPPKEETEPAAIQTVTISNVLDPGTYAPGPALMEVTGAGTVYAAVRVTHLSAADVVTVVWDLDDAEVQRDTLTGQDLPDNWVAFPFKFAAGTTPINYEITVFLNGTPIAQRALTVR